MFHKLIRKIVPLLVAAPLVLASPFFLNGCGGSDELVLREATDGGGGGSGLLAKLNSRMFNPQPEPPAQLVGFNPQPEPPGK